MRIDFTLRRLAGFVDVTLVPNVDPEALGCRGSGFGFPVCTATVSYEGRGYAAALGWIQLVRSTDGAGAQFELDPYEPLGTLPHPFCWFGFAPTLFDAPSRARRDDLDWTAHSFLSFIGEPQEVRAIVGFRWGFVVREEAVVIEDAAPLAADTWDAHLPLLRHAHQSWRFAPGYHNR